MSGLLLLMSLQRFLKHLRSIWPQQDFPQLFHHDQTLRPLGVRNFVVAVETCNVRPNVEALTKRAFGGARNFFAFERLGAGACGGQHQSHTNYPAAQAHDLFPVSTRSMTSTASSAKIPKTHPSRNQPKAERPRLAAASAVTTAKPSQMMRSSIGSFFLPTNTHLHHHGERQRGLSTFWRTLLRHRLPYRLWQQRYLAGSCPS